jgi:hypothetical protein
VFRVIHLVAIAVVVLESWLGGWCPLTVLEGYLRRLAGESGYETSFVGYWLDRLIFFDAPAWLFSLVYSLFALLVVASFVGYPPRRRGLYW